MNHKETHILIKDIRIVYKEEIEKHLNGEPIHLIAGCPPCQGYSSIRRLNKPTPADDDRNDLMDEFVRLITEFKPFVFMMENVPGLVLNKGFERSIEMLKFDYNYKIDYKVVNVRNFEVPQSRKRLVVLGSRLAEIKIKEPDCSPKYVKDVIEGLPYPEESEDPLHKIFPHHTPRILSMIKDIPKNGGSRKDLGENRQLKCHRKLNTGFNDVYGRLSWDNYSSTITGGCLNPSKGRFLHPGQNRCISAREAALLQSFPPDYKFPLDVSRSALALMIGNALPPKFCYYMGLTIRKHLDENLG